MISSEEEERAKPGFSPGKQCKRSLHSSECVSFTASLPANHEDQCTLLVVAKISFIFLVLVPDVPGSCRHNSKRTSNIRPDETGPLCGQAIVSHSKLELRMAWEWLVPASILRRYPGVWLP